MDMIDENRLEESFDGKGNWRVKPGNWGKTPPDQYEQKELAKILGDCLGTLQEKQAEPHQDSSLPALDEAGKDRLRKIIDQDHSSSKDE